MRKDHAQRRIAVTQEALDEKMDNLRGAVTMGETRVLGNVGGAVTTSSSIHQVAPCVPPAKLLLTLFGN